MQTNLHQIEPFFIIGNPRSGTTLLRLMLTQHDEIVVPPECGFSVWLSDQFTAADFSFNETKSRFVSEVVQTRKFETWGLKEQELNDFLRDQQCNSYRDAVLAIYLFYAFKNGGTPHLVGDKNNFYINHLDKIDLLFGGPRLVFIVRDGRDVACSYLALRSIGTGSKYTPRLPGQIEEIAEEWAVNNARVMSYLQHFPDRSFLIKYEDLINRPETELRRACDFFSIEYQPKMLMYYKSNDEPNDFLAWKQKILLPPDPTNCGMYTRLLSAEDTKTVEGLAKGPLSYFGYL